MNHPSANAMFKSLKLFGFKDQFTLNDCVEINKNCSLCQQCNFRQKSISEKSQTHVDLPFNHTVFQDLKEMPEHGIGGYKYISVMIDAGTRYVSLFPLTQKNHAIQHLIRWNNTNCAKFGNIKNLHTDNGTELVNFAYKDLCMNNGIHYHTGAPYTPESQGLVERFNSTLTNNLTKLFQSALRDVPTIWWPHCLAGIAKIYNFTVHSSTGTAPHVAKYGGEIQADSEMFIGDKVWFIPSGPKLKSIEPRAMPGIFLSSDSNCAKLLCKINNVFRLERVHSHRINKHVGNDDSSFIDTSQDTPQMPNFVVPSTNVELNAELDTIPQFEDQAIENPSQSDERQQDDIEPFFDAESDDSELVQPELSPETPLRPGAGIIYRRPREISQYHVGIVLKPTNTRVDVARVSKLNDNEYFISDMTKCTREDILEQFDPIDNNGSIALPETVQC